MQSIERTITDIQLTSLGQSVFTDGSLFFDIETTGFSPKNNRIYMIGIAYRKNGHICIHQWMTEQKSEEAEMLSSFLSFIQNYTALLSFNGIGFDLPFLQARCSSYQLDFNPALFTTIDFFKLVSGLKSMLNLPNYKQKTIEAFLGVDREDCYTGGDLIDIYRQYEKEPDRELLNLLLLHNYEDVKGMLSLLGLYEYTRFYVEAETIIDARIEAGGYSEDAMHFSLILQLKSRCCVPKKLHYNIHGIYIQLEGHTATFHIPVFKGELKYFYPNYKDYYYLPMEDTAIHKSLSQFVDKDYREKCHPHNCYIRREGIYLPQFTEWRTPAYFREYKDSMSYFEFSRDMLEDVNFLLSYIQSLISST